MSAPMRYRHDPARFAVDTVDGETIVMDLVDGRLFLLEDGGAAVWDLLVGGVPLDVLEAAVEQRFGASVRDDVRTFVTGLVAQGLIAEASDAGDTPAAPGVPAAPELPAELGELRITAYDDMTSIITMDPIHDVDPDRGWPFDAPADTSA